MDLPIHRKTERTRLPACTGRAVQAPLPKIHFLLMKVAAWQLQRAPSPHEGQGAVQGTPGEPKDIGLRVLVQAGVCPWQARAPGTHASLPPASHPRRHEAGQGRTSPACAGRPAGTTTVLIIRNNSRSRWKQGCQRCHGLGSGSPSEAALPSCLFPPPFLPDDISLQNRFLTSEGLIGQLWSRRRGESPL